MKKIILVLLGIFVFSFKPQGATAFFHFRPPKPTFPPRPTIVIPTWPSRKWIFRPTKTLTPTRTPTPTLTPTPTQPATSNSPNFKLELANPSVPVLAGNTFQVKILINTGGIETINGDALLNYDETKLTINSAQSGNFYTFFSASPLGGTGSKYLVSSWEESIAHAKSTTSDSLFATLSITAKEHGMTTIGFECTSGSEADSGINRASDSMDIINCPLISLNLYIQR